MRVIIPLSALIHIGRREVVLRMSSSLHSTMSVSDQLSGGIRCSGVRSLSFGRAFIEIEDRHGSFIEG